jgi:methionyl-tRNA synthetase
MINKYFKGVVIKATNLTQIDHEYISKLDIFKEFNTKMQELKFNQALEILWTAIRETNSYINQVTPWKEKDETRLGTIMNILVSSIKMFAEYLDPIMPSKSQRIFKQYNLKKENKFEFDFIDSVHILGKKDNLFTKIILEEKEEKKQEKKREGFASLNLKVGKILEIWQHPEAEKLYIEKIDLGEEKPRQIVSGLKDYYKLDELKGKKVIVVTNLKPAKLRGEKSEGMVLVSESEDKNIGLLETEAEIGTNLICNNEIADNPNRIKIDSFFKIKMTSDGKKIYYKDKEVKAKNKELKIDKNIKGNIC